MTDRLYEYMDWPRIEAVAYGEENLPREILGPQAVKGAVLIQCFFPNAKSVKIHNKKDGKKYPMELADESGFYAALLPGKELPSYEFIVEDMDGKNRRMGTRTGSRRSLPSRKRRCSGRAFIIKRIRNWARTL